MENCLPDRTGLDIDYNPGNKLWPNVKNCAKVAFPRHSVLPPLCKGGGAGNFENFENGGGRMISNFLGGAGKRGGLTFFWGGAD